jgi:hypothetical protein
MPNSPTRAAEAARFSVGVTYWPTRQGTAMWQRFDAGEIREDFARIAALGLDTVRVFLRWDDFAPEPTRTDPVMLDRFTKLVNLVRDAGLRIMPVLLGAEVAGVPFLPRWARDERHPDHAGNIYSGPLLDAQVRYAGDVAAAVGNDDTIAAWDLAHRFAQLRAPRGGKLRTGGHETAPASEAEIAAWAQALKRAVTAHSRRPITIGTSSDDLTVDRNVRLAALGPSLDFTSMQGASIALPFARNRLDPEAVPFLAFVAAAFSFRPVLVTAIGVPACGPNKLSLFEHLPALDDLPLEPIATDDPLFEPYACLTEDEQAAYARATIDRLHADGRLGAYWWCWSDYPAETPLAPVADRAPFVRACGIIRSDGTEKPIAAVLSSIAREQRAVVPARDMPMISAEYYYRTLPTSMRTVYDAFLLHVAEGPSRASTQR